MTDIDAEATDAESNARDGLAEKELFLLLLVGIAFLMGVTGFVLIVT